MTSVTQYLAGGPSFPSRARRTLKASQKRGEKDAVVTAVASARSLLDQTQPAVAQAVEQALRGLGEKPTVGFLFASPRHPLDEALKEAKARAGCEFLGCHTAGEFTEQGLTSKSLVVLLTSLDANSFVVRNAIGVKADPAGAARQLTGGFADLQAKSAKVGAALSTTVLLVDGLAGSGERLVKDVLAGTRPYQQVVGGAAGDDGQFKTTSVGTSRQSGSDSAAALHVFGKKPWGVGVDHGLRAQTRPMRVTRAHQNVVYELDGRPAIEAYRTHARSRGVELTDQTTAPFLIANELGVYFLNDVQQARAPLRVGSEGELHLAADLPQGASVCILDGEPDEMVKACGRAAAQAKAGLQGAKAAGVLVFDCICRGMILGEGFQRELDAVKEQFPGVPVAGFLTYGEIARFSGRLDGWHNATVVVTAIPE